MNYLPMESIDWLVIHCSATSANEDMRFADLRHVHMLRGEADIGYHYVVERDGTVVKGRNDLTPGSHASGYNRHSLGICLIGGRKGETNKTEDNFTTKQKASLRQLLTVLTKDNEDAEVAGHADLPGVTHGCPGFNVKEFWYGTARK